MAGHHSLVSWWETLLSVSVINRENSKLFLQLLQHSAALLSMLTHSPPGAPDWLTFICTLSTKKLVCECCFGFVQDCLTETSHTKQYAAVIFSQKSGSVLLLWDCLGRDGKKDRWLDETWVLSLACRAVSSLRELIKPIHNCLMMYTSTLFLFES